MQKKVLGIIGSPISHTLSPAMHNRAAEILGLPYNYVAFDVAPSGLKKAIDSFRTLGIAGLNVTVPHKEKVVQYLDELDSDALTIGAVNTISVKGGRLKGFNTDRAGFLRSLKVKGFSPRGKKTSIIGAGGSARAIGVSLLNAGAGHVTVINRTASNGRKLADHLSKFGQASFIGSASPEAADALLESDLVVQATSLGMKKADPLPAPKQAFRKKQWVYDIIYSPEETRFLKNAKSKGARTLNGMGMLIYQGSASFKIWTGHNFPEDKIFIYLKRYLSREKRSG